MAIGMNYNTSEGGAILPPREHGCKLVSVELTEGKDYNTGEPIEQIKFTFEGVKPLPGTQEQGRISIWTGLSYGNPKAKLTNFLDAVFGRALTQEESRKIDLQRLEGLTGYVSVLPHTKKDGAKTSIYGGFRHPDKRELPNPADYYGFSEEAMDAVRSAAKTPAPKAVGPGVSASAPAPAPVAEADDLEADDLEDVFAEENQTRPFGGQ